MINLIPKILPRSEEERQADLERRLVSREAEAGGKLFGPIPKGHKRQFFCLDESTWIWYEEWIENGQRRWVTTRYEIRPNDIIKVQDGQPTQSISTKEARHLYKAAELYYRHISALYQHTAAA